MQVKVGVTNGSAVPSMRPVIGELAVRSGSSLIGRTAPVPPRESGVSWQQMLNTPAVSSFRHDIATAWSRYEYQSCAIRYIDKHEPQPDTPAVSSITADEKGGDVESLSNNAEAACVEPTPVSGKILHPAELERYCRLFLKASNKRSFQTIQFVLDASTRFGDAWFPGLEIWREISGRYEPYITEELRQMCADFGMAEYRMDGGVAFFRLKGELLDLGHPLGRRAQAIRRDIQTLYKGAARKTPLGALVLVAIHNYKFFTSKDIYEFIGPVLCIGNVDRKKDICNRELKSLSEAGIILVHRGSSKGRPITAIPLTKFEGV